VIVEYVAPVGICFAFPIEENVFILRDENTGVALRLRELTSTHMMKFCKLWSGKSLVVIAVPLHRGSSIGRRLFAGLRERVHSERIAGACTFMGHRNQTGVRLGFLGHLKSTSPRTRSSNKSCNLSVI
jgi:hypothetical protein